jgi:hypothetical protein
MNDVLLHMVEQVSHARSRELAAYEKYIGAYHDEKSTQPQREQLWADWVLTRSVLDRRISILRSEDADRAQKGVR